MYFNYAQYKQKGFALVLILIGVLIIAGIAGGAYYSERSFSPKPTMIPQNTSFPNKVNETDTWKTYTNKNSLLDIQITGL